MPSPTWLAEDQIKRLPPARGVAGEALFAQNMLGGWMFLPEHELTGVQINLHGQPLAYVPLWERSDVADLYPRFPHALRCGYQIKLPAGLLRPDDINRVTTVGYADGEPRCRQRAFAFADEFPPRVPIPPSDLVTRTQGPYDEMVYKRLGYRFYRDVLDAVSPHREPRTLRRVLDWGCGSGRVAANFLADPDGYVVHACDPHPASIAWCQTNLPAGRFDVSPWQPPLQYTNAAFDLVIGLGVVYYFSRDEFAAWLLELTRVLAKRGILVISIQGAFAAKVRLQPDGMKLLERQGIINLAEYDAQHPPSPDEKLFRGGYYWTPECVKEVVSGHFQILDYLVGAFGGDQDLVVMERVG